MDTHNLRPSSMPTLGKLWDSMSRENLVAFTLTLIAFSLTFLPLNHFTEYAFFSLLILWILSESKDGTLYWKRTALDLPIGLFLVWILITLPWASDADYSFGEWRKTVAHILMFYFVVHALEESHFAKRILIGFFAGVAAVSLLEAGYFFQEGRSLFALWPRGGDLTGSSQWLSVFVVLGFPGLILILNQFLSWKGWIYFVLYSVALTLGLLVCSTRAAWVAVCIQIIVFASLKMFRQGWMPLIGGILTIVAIVFALLNLDQHVRAISKSQFANASSMDRRFITWAVAVNDIKESPVVGVGYGKHSFKKFHNAPKPPMHTHVHNTFLSKAVQIGIPGFLLFVGMLILVLKKSYDLFRACQQDGEGELALVIHLMIVGLIARNFFDDMWIGNVAYLFWLVTGLLFCLNCGVKPSSSRA